MSHFYGTLQGSRGEATRCGTKNSGVVTEAAGWGGCVKTYVYEYEGVDKFRVTLEPWQNSGGKSKILAEGELSCRYSDDVPTCNCYEGEWCSICEPDRE